MQARGLLTEDRRRERGPEGGLTPGRRETPPVLSVIATSSKAKTCLENREPGVRQTLSFSSCFNLAHLSSSPWHFLNNFN